MSYLLKSKPKGLPHPRIIITVGLFLLIVLFAFLFPNFIRTVFYSIARPVWSVRNMTIKPIALAIGFFKSKNALITENLSLQDQLIVLKLKETDYDILLKENQELKNQFGRGLTNNRILSWVLSKPPLSPYDTFVIDVGSGEGVTLGNKVYVSENIIIGIIVSVTSHTSLVKLFSSGGEKQEAVLSRTGASFEVVGHGGANFQIEVPKDADILWGDVFMYPGISASTIGSVYYIDTNSQSSFKTIYLRIPGNVFTSKHVFVEKSQ